MLVSQSDAAVIPSKKSFFDEIVAARCTAQWLQFFVVASSSGK
jgi:hypothetical protein